MNILKYGYIALALFSGAITTSGSESDRSYEKTINVDTITWEQLDPGLRKYYIKTVICGLENADKLMTGDDPLNAIATVMEQALQVDASDLTGEYKAYYEASLPLTKAVISDIRKADRIPLPTSMSELGTYQQKVMDTMLAIRAKHQSEIDEINRKYPNAAALFDTPRPGIEEPKINELFNKKFNLEQMVYDNMMSSSSPKEGIRKTVQELRNIAESQN